MERKPTNFASRRPSDNNSGSGGAGVSAVAATAAGGGAKKDAGNNFGRFARGGGGGGRRSGRSDAVSAPSNWPRGQRAFSDKRLPASKQNICIDRSSDRHGSQVTDAEIGSASRPGGRKPSLNHLLNFTYGSRGDARGNSHHGRSGGAASSAANSIWATKKHKYNKEQFLQANCQFVVREGEDYAAHTADPDQLVNWESIEQVRIPGHEVSSCPICLYPPVAAKMTRCGHVYCWACMLHYLALTDKTWRKCPICYEAVHKGDLKSVVSLETACYRVGQPIRMQLMRRERGSVISLPSARWTELALETSSASGQLRVGVQGLDAAGENACYAKLLVATRAQVLDVIGREENELKAALVCYEYDLGPESCFVEDALEQLRMRREKLLEAVPYLEETSKSDLEKEEDKDVSAGNAEKVLGYTSAFSDREEEEGDDEEEVDDDVHNEDIVHSASVELTADVNQERSLEVPAAPNQQTQNQGHGHGKDTYYFYQAMDGQHIYMHSVNVAMLVREYGSLEHCPDIVSALIVERETVSMNDDLRNRLRCLGHLPLTCQFELVELDFTPAAADADVVHVISRDTLLAFREEIKKRSQRRSRRAREENRRERQLRKEDNKQTATPIPVPRLHLESERQFPACGSDGGDGGSSSSPTDEMAQLPSPSDLKFDSPTGSAAASSSGMSFAQMLRAGKAKSGDVHRAIKSSVGGHDQAQGHGRSMHQENERDSDAGSPVPDFRDSFSAALWSALDDHPLAGVRSGDESHEPMADRDGHHRIKKGKKATKRLLFSTSVVRSK